MLPFLQQLKASKLSLEEALNAAAEYYALSRARDPLNYIDRTFLHHPPGHYYSPLPDRAELDRVRKRIYGKPPPDSIPGVDLKEREQLKLYAQLVKYYPQFPFKEEKTPGLRYYFNNGNFCHADAFWLFSMLLRFKPKRLVEVGSGFSSCVTLDTRDNFMDSSLELVFIEPDPEARLLGNMGDVHQENTTICKALVQDVPMEIFHTLEAGDVLFVDGSHVGKIGSDVLYILFEVLPALKPGVFIHFHDLFYPFEYPQEWLEKGWAWNEDYFMRAFLQYNSKFDIVLFGHYLGVKHHPMLLKHTPVCCKNTGGSLWLRKL